MYFSLLHHDKHQLCAEKGDLNKRVQVGEKIQSVYPDLNLYGLAYRLLCVLTVLGDGRNS